MKESARFECIDHAGRSFFVIEWQVGIGAELGEPYYTLENGAPVERKGQVTFQMSETGTVLKVTAAG